MRMIKEPSCDEAAGAGSTRAADWGQIRGRGLRSLRTAGSRCWPYRSGSLLPDNCRRRGPADHVSSGAHRHAWRRGLIRAKSAAERAKPAGQAPVSNTTLPAVSVRRRCSACPAAAPEELAMSADRGYAPKRTAVTLQREEHVPGNRYGGRALGGHVRRSRRFGGHSGSVGQGMSVSEQTRVEPGPGRGDLRVSSTVPQEDDRTAASIPGRPSRRSLTNRCAR